MVQYMTKNTAPTQAQKIRTGDKVIDSAGNRWDVMDARGFPKRVIMLQRVVPYATVNSPFPKTITYAATVSACLVLESHDVLTVEIFDPSAE